MRADDQRCAATSGRCARRSAFGDRRSAQHQRHLNAEWGEESLRRRSVLTGQQFCRCQEGALMPSGRRGGSGNEGDRGLARAHIALQEAQHRRPRRKVGKDLVNCTPLITRPRCLAL